MTTPSVLLKNIVSRTPRRKNRDESLIQANIESKFAVSYDSVETLKASQVSELPGHVRLYAFFPKNLLQALVATHGLWFEEGVYNLTPRSFLNDKFPNIQPMKIKEMLELAWRRST